MPALAYGDRVKETSTTTGTGTLDVDGAVAGFQNFVDGVGDGNQCYYLIRDPVTNEWEEGLGTVTDASPDTLSRDRVDASSDGGSAIDFADNAKDVLQVIPARAMAGDYALANLSGSVSMLTGVAKTLDLWQTRDSQGDAFTISTDRITCERPGVVIAAYAIRFDSTTAGTFRTTRLKHFDSIDVEQRELLFNGNPSPATRIIGGCGIFEMAEGDYFEVHGHQDSGGTMSTGTSENTLLNVIWLGT